ncbi:META domain-containing protein [Aliidiomarina halalkaliphila]|uniref:META domain-containing protein n=1 Tax=Aliidiomarina halalkaliphila TaxID=2593535 RepID=A0A552X0L9_9GAMM|nr:META domain-containing protein [Aliidiomarina halalkaliphila]TRW48429.1 META domain-containing protein [Aliidiomarina halalkaliphila]
MQIKAMNQYVRGVMALGMLMGIVGCASVPEESEPEVVEPVVLEDAGELQMQARGNEPFWMADIYHAQVHYEFMGESRNIEIIADTIVQNDQQTMVFADDRGSISLWVSICHDTMTGMPYPYVAELNTGERVVAGCAGHTDTLIANSQWHIVAINDDAVPDNVSMTLNFGDDGRLYGQSGCNRYFGRYTLTGEGVRFSQMGLTRMACEEPRMQLESRYINALGDVILFDFDAHDNLVLHTAAGDKLFTSSLPRETK